MHHELQHQLNGDTNNRRYIAYYNKKSHLADLQKTSYVRCIFKKNIKNPQGQNLQDILNENGQKNISAFFRYKEFRADYKTLKAIQCPICLQEIALKRLNIDVYRSNGYLNPWQYQPRIDQLKNHGMICQHHHENGENVDNSICDSSTLAKRMIILQKNK